MASNTPTMRCCQRQSSRIGTSVIVSYQTRQLISWMNLVPCSKWWKMEKASTSQRMSLAKSFLKSLAFLLESSTRAKRPAFEAWKKISESESRDKDLLYDPLPRLFEGLVAAWETESGLWRVSCSVGQLVLVRRNSARHLRRPTMGKKKIWFDWIWVNTWIDSLRVGWWELLQVMLDMKREVNWLKPFADHRILLSSLTS